MQCPHCQQPIAPTMKFCGTCGAPLAPAPRHQSLPSQPLLLFGGAGLAGLGLLLRWENGRAYSTPTYTKYELKYSDGSTAQRDYLPSANTTYTGASNGFSFITLLPLLVAIFLAVQWRSRPWPMWAKVTLLVMVAFVALVGTTNGLFNGTFGPFVYLAGALVMGAGALQLFRRSA